MDDLLKDMNDGCCIGALIGFYCPDIINITGNNYCIKIITRTRSVFNLWSRGSVSQKAYRNLITGVSLFMCELYS